MKKLDPKSRVQNLKPFDAVIIGGGAAGMSAAMWCDDLGLSALLLEEAGELGGQLLRVFNRIENHLGLETANGREMREAFVRQIAGRRFELFLNASISEIDPENKTVHLAGGEAVSARSMIVATGVRRRRLGVEGEEKFQNNRGILLSGKRGRETVTDKRVVIVGGGDAAIENALILAETASEVTVVHRRDEFRARREFLEKARANPRISFLTRTILTEISGGESVEAVGIKHLATGSAAFLPADAVLLRIGVAPNTELFAGKLLLDENGYIKIDAECRTNVAGVYAAGDVANPTAPTVSSAVGMGATAVKSIFIWLSS